MLRALHLCLLYLVNPLAQTVFDPVGLVLLVGCHFVLRDVPLDGLPDGLVPGELVLEQIFFKHYVHVRLRQDILLRLLLDRLDGLAVQCMLFLLLPS